MCHELFVYFSWCLHGWTFLVCARLWWPPSYHIFLTSGSCFCTAPKGGGPASGPKREREQCATKTCCSIWHEGAELGGREPLQPQHGSQRPEPDGICDTVS